MAVEQHDQFQLLAVTPFDRTAQLGELNEQEAMGQGKVLLQQAIALERPRHHRHGRIGIIEPPRAQRALGQALDPIATGLARKHRAGIAQQLFVEAKRLFISAAQVQRQGIQVEAVERQLGTGAQGQAQAGLGFRFAGGQAPEHGGGVAEIFGVVDLQRPQRHRVRGAVLAAGLGFTAQGGTQHRITG